MTEITKYGDIGTKERHNKFGGVSSDVVDGQLRGVCFASDYLEIFKAGGVWNEEQARNANRLCFDYEVGCLSTHSHPIQNYHRDGGGKQDWNERQEEARKRHNAAIKYNGEFIKISNLCHLMLEHGLEYNIPQGVHISAPWKLKQIADRLIKYYCLLDNGTI